MTPSNFRVGGKGELIHFAVGEGACPISLNDGPESLVRDLQDRFPQAQLITGDKDFERCVAKIVGFVEVPHPAAFARGTLAGPQ